MKQILILVICLVLVNCKQDECTKIANKQRLSVGMTSKSSTSKIASGFVPHTQSNPYIMNWMNYDIIDNGIRSCGGAWVGFPKDIFIHKDNKLTLTNINCVVQGNIYGEGSIDLSCKSILVVQGTIDESIIQMVADSSQVIIDKPLSDGDNNIPWKTTVEVPCSWVLPKQTLEDGIRYYYTEYDGTGIQAGTNWYKGKL